jgi:hypothetical protein
MWPFGVGAEPTQVAVQTAGIPAHCPDPGVGGTIARGIATGFQHAIEPLGILSTNIAISASVVVWLIAGVMIVLLVAVTWTVLPLLLKRIISKL